MCMNLSVIILLPGLPEAKGFDLKSLTKEEAMAIHR